MKQQSISSTLTIKHQPCGEQHPYLPLACERFPRNPSAGEFVTLGIETGHHPSADAVWCVWQIEGNSSADRTEAVKIADGETSDLWQVHLPAFKGNEVVQYRHFARSADQQAENEEFTFSVLTWMDVVAIASVEETTERLVVGYPETANPNSVARNHPSGNDHYPIKFAVQSPIISVDGGFLYLIRSSLKYSRG